MWLVRIIILIIQNCIVYNSHYTIQPYQSLIIDVHVLNAQHSLILIALIYSYMRNSLLEIEVNKKCVIKHSLPQVIEKHNVVNSLSFAHTYCIWFCLFSIPESWWCSLELVSGNTERPLRLNRLSDVTYCRCQTTVKTRSHAGRIRTSTVY